MLNSKSLIKISAGLILVSTIGFSGKAHAQTAIVNSSGTASNSCTLTASTAGILVKSGTLAAMEGSAGVSGFTVGNAGTATVNCTNGGSLTVAAPAPVGAVPMGFTPAVLQSVVQRGSGTSTNPADFTSANTGGPFDTNAWTKPTTPLAIPLGVSALNVAMVAGAPTAGPVPSGNYSYDVTLTVVSN